MKSKSYLCENESQWINLFVQMCYELPVYISLHLLEMRVPVASSLKKVELSVYMITKFIAHFIKYYLTIKLITTHI